MASLFGDVDCDDDIDAVDALIILRFVVGLPVSQTEPCPDIGDALVISAVTARSDSPVTAAMPFAAAFRDSAPRSRRPAGREQVDTEGLDQHPE